MRGSLQIQATEEMTMKKPAIAALVSSALAAALSAQTATITTEWEARMVVNSGTPQISSLPLGTTYGVGTNETRSHTGPGSSITNNLVVQSNFVRIATASFLDLLSSPGPTVDMISEGEILVMIPAGRGRLNLRGHAHSSGGPSGMGRVFVDVFDDGSIDFAPPATFQSPPVELDIAIDSVTDTPVRVEIDSSLIGSTFLDEAFADVELTWIPNNKVVLPDTHYLMESSDQLGTVGTTSFWSSASRRFQILYEASHFVEHGVAGPIMIEGLYFRGEDGEPSAGGHNWANAQVRVGATSLDSATLATTFATNVAGATTTMGATATINVVEGASSGATPNNFNIVLDLTAAGTSFLFDPTSARPNLLIDIVLPSGATPSSLVMSMQNTSGTTAALRGAAILGSSAGATVGAPAPPLVVGVEFDGSGGYKQPTPARNEFYGAACGGSPSSFYQSFLPGQSFDVTGLTLTPDTYPSPNTYTVSAGAPPVDATQGNASPNSQLDDGVVSHPLGFTFAFPGGSTTSVGACTNGYIWLNSSSSADFRPSVPRLLGATGTGPRLAPCWYDLHAGRNASLLPNSGLHVRTTGSAPNRVAYVTWLDVGIFNSPAAGAAVHRMQCAMHEATGVVEFRYGNMPTYCANSSGAAHPAVVGFSRGEIASVLSVDPQSRDLSHEVPFATSPEGASGNMGLRSVTTPIAGGADYGGRMFVGQSITWDAFNVPAGATIGALLLDFAPSVPGLSIPGIHAPGCVESTTINPLLWEVVLFPGSTVTGNLAVDIAPGYHPDYTNFKLYAQFVLLDLSGGPSIVTASSNAIQHTVGGR